MQLLSVWNKLADDQGYLTRLSIDYDWSDNWKFGLLWVDYSAERDSFYSAFRNNDMLQFNARFSFQKLTQLLISLRINLRFRGPTQFCVNFG